MATTLRTSPRRPRLLLRSKPRAGDFDNLEGRGKPQDHSALEEVKEWRGTSVAERWRLAQACARDAMWAARASGIASRILDREDPLPESTVRALERLRAASGWGHGRR
jgi:hypothetical protein